MGDTLLLPPKKKRYSFSKEIRLKKRRQFQEIDRLGTKKMGRLVVIQMLATPSHDSIKIGITASKSFGKAHVRNRFKRLIREIFRLNLENLPSHLSLNIRPRTPAKEASFQEIQEEILRLFNG